MERSVPARRQTERNCLGNSTSMELPSRSRGDELLRPGELTAIRKRLRAVAAKHDLTTVIACAFDYRTRMLPFILADRRMVPAGVREVGAAMVDSGFPKTRIVLQLAAEWLLRQDVCVHGTEEVAVWE